MNITQHEPDIVNDAIIEDLIADFDGFVEKRDFVNADIVIDNLANLQQYLLATSLAKRLTARKMTVPSEYRDMVPCSCPKGGMYSDGVVCRKCDGGEWVPADYGEEVTLEEVSAKSIFAVVQTQHDTIMNALRNEDEEVIY